MGHVLISLPKIVARGNSAFISCYLRAQPQRVQILMLDLLRTSRHLGHVIVNGTSLKKAYWDHLEGWTEHLYSTMA